MIKVLAVGVDDIISPGQCAAVAAAPALSLPMFL